MFFDKPKRKRRLRYCVKVKGTIVSKHYTKKAAFKASKSIRGAQVYSLITKQRVYR